MGLFDFLTKHKDALNIYQGINQSFYFNDLINHHDFIDLAYKKNVHVYSVVNLILNTVTRFKIEHLDSEGVAIENSPILAAINNPNENQGRSEFIEETILYKLLLGEFFIYKITAENGVNKGKPLGFQIIPPQLVNEIKVNEKGYPIEYVLTNSTRIPAEKMIHGANIDPDYSTYRGLSPLVAAAKSVQTSNDAKTAQMKSLQNMAPAGFITGTNGGESLTEPQASALKDKLKTMWSGVRKAGEWVITGANLKFERMGYSPVYLDIIQQEKWNIRDIANIYGVPTVLLNDPDSKTNANYKESRQHLILNVAQPILQTVLDELTRSFLPKDETLNIDNSDFAEMQEDLQQKVAALNQAFWLTINERRKAMGYDEVEGGDEVLVPSGSMPLNFDFDYELEKMYNVNK
jgi:HK97 family phage portal protein